MPSTIPPIEIPQEIRDRVKVNGTKPDEEQSAPVLTPPGAGGDVHGDPGVGVAPQRLRPPRMTRPA